MAKRTRQQGKRGSGSARESRQQDGLDEHGCERPPFLAAFPSDPELRRLVDAYQRGDYRLVRQGAAALAERTDDARVRKAARELRRRIDPDPLARYLIIAAVALLVFLVVWAYGAAH